MEGEARERGTEDVHLGTAVEALLEAGEEQAAALLLDLEDMEYDFVDEAYAWDGSAQVWAVVEARCTVPAFLLPRFQDEGLRSKIISVLQTAAVQDDMFVRYVTFHQRQAAPGWRERAEKRLGVGPSNQAQVGGAPKKDWVTVGRLRFRSAPEAQVYRALRRAQERLPGRETITIVPNCGARVLRHTWEPDFLVAYRGRVGVIEVDGPHHAGRSAADKSRDRTYEDCGVAYVDRWVVEDTIGDEDLDMLVERFLRRLSER